ncbi:DNA mismatch repair protein MutS domain protein [Desulforamulus reducens MI-1]|uniref:DNA mismatch repair protein MutS domain protein n=1 Tax=Desulforamulus reducens (strain ATCC BAA-1160 / DSM 100696 / MI-1) TaxID=349161 RepID=A4J1F4_DESRM|nr:MutS family DNA mismatch repair protein [Desulforamulus reducens]ABO48907.1 DNA mismatch repair protein MutS domain protein [Desulforamulus reducens MI-1]
MEQHIKKIYQKNKERYEIELDGLKKTDNTFVFSRSVVALSVVGLLLYAYLKGLSYLYLSTVPLVFLFLVMVNKHQRVKKQMTQLESLVQINERALLRLCGQWTGFQQRGEEYIASEHPYSGDLNIFGQGSLFQYLNAANLVTGNEALAKLLSAEEPCYEQIRPRQSAIKDLAARLDWRQLLQAMGMGSGYKPEDAIKLWNWAREKPLFLHGKLIYLLWLLPITTLILLILMSQRLVPSYVPLILLILQVILVTASQAIISRKFKDTERSAAELARLSRLLKYIEGEEFQAPLLVELQNRLIQKKQTASQQVKALEKIAALINLRYSVVYHFINALIFCDLYTLRTLEQWKSQYGTHLEQWFRVIGQFEALSSLATLAHDNPHWAFPEVTKAGPYLTATTLGHPLINAETRVSNDVSLPQPGTVHIITGSNMSGKSTLLRTVGINLVLAYAGAPVCASFLSCSLMSIYTSMRIQDNLEESTSSFYAELKRIKLVIEATRQGKSLIFLLDEIFRGTNSRDRITGARTVIKNLALQPAIGFVTTHDLELSTLENEYPQHIKNYHFTDEIIENKITFDYRLKEGVSQTTNAIALMKMVGIDV